MKRFLIRACQAGLVLAVLLVAAGYWFTRPGRGSREQVDVAGRAYSRVGPEWAFGTLARNT